MREMFETAVFTNLFGSARLFRDARPVAIAEPDSARETGSHASADEGVTGSIWNGAGIAASPATD